MNDSACRVVATALTFVAAPAYAVDCQVTDFQVQSYESGTTYVYGVVGANYRHLFLCTGSGSTNTCDSPGTDRNVSLAMTALTAGRQLWFYVGTFATCSDVPTHTRPVVWYMK